jgi:hypothetical protein
MAQEKKIKSRGIGRYLEDVAVGQSGSRAALPAPRSGVPRLPMMNKHGGQGIPTPHGGHQKVAMLVTLRWLSSNSFLSPDINILACCVRQDRSVSPRNLLSHVVWGFVEENILSAYVYLTNGTTFATLT